MPRVVLGVVSKTTLGEFESHRVRQFKMSTALAITEGEKKVTVPFHTLRERDWFRHCAETYIKVKNNIGNNDEINAVNIQSGFTTSFHSEAPIVPIRRVIVEVTE